MRKGRKNQPFFKIVVTEEKKSSTGGRFVEELGFYNPLTKEKSLNGERAKYWMSVGAKPSDTMHNMLLSENVIEGTRIPKHKKSKKEKLAEAVTAPTGEPVKTEEAAASTTEQPKTGEVKQEETTPEPAPEEPKKEEAPVQEPALKEAPKEQEAPAPEETPTEEKKEEPAPEQPKEGTLPNPLTS